MSALHISLISVGGSLIFLFLVYLFLIMPSLSRKGEMKKYTSHKYAHRGLHGIGVAENSMTAFARAVEGGYGIELDVRLSKDNKLVVFHDNTLDRITGIDGKVSDYDYDELKNMKLSGTDDTIPLFLDVLRLVDGKVPLLIELKEEAGSLLVTEKALELLESYGGPFVIESFNPMSLRLIKKQKPQILRGFLAANYMAEKKHRKPLFLLLQLFLFNSICRPHFISYEHKGYRNFGFLVLRTVFRPVCFCWTVTSKDDEMAAYAHKFDTVIFEGYETENKKERQYEI